MKRRVIHTVLALLAMAGLATTLRQDLANLALYQGKTRLRAGDVAGAEAAYARAVALGGDAAPLAYNLGVSLYRKGEYPRARERFAAALAAAGPELAVASHYNRGNSQFRLGERVAAGDSQAARRFFQAAIADYGEALALTPGAIDVGSNLNLVRVRLTALENELAHHGSQRTPGADDPQQSEAGTGTGPQAGTRQASVQPAARQPQAADGAAQQADRADASASAGKPRRELTRNQAERLLNEARGREKLAGPAHGGNPIGRLAKPERDW